MYRPHSLYSDIGDVEILEYDGKLHMFHLVIPNRDLIAHCVSEDGLTWRELPAAIATGAPGSMDDDMIRTISVTPCNGRFYMLYAACSRKDGGRVERICMATSKDLTIWEKLPQFSGIEACGKYYEDAETAKDYVNWRDPKPYYEDGTYYCVICARRREGAILRRGCVALMTSQDMLHWTYQAPLFLPGDYFAVECPQIYKIGSQYYLLGAIMEDGSQRYWVADNLKGPYRIAGGENLLMPPGSHYAGRLARFRGRDVYLCWTAAREDGPSPFGLRTEIGAPIRYIPALLDVVPDEQGRLTLRSVKAWERFEGAGKPIAQAALNHTICSNRYASHRENLFISESGTEMWTTRETYGSFRWNCSLQMEGYCGGLVFRANDDGAAYRLEFYPYEQRVLLKSHVRSHRRDGTDWFDHRIIQSAHLDSAGKAVRVSLRDVGGEIEISLNGRVRLATVSTAALSGYIGVFANCASIQIEEMTVIEMSVPNSDLS